MAVTYVQGGTLHRVRCSVPLTRATTAVAAKVTLCSARQHVLGCDRCAGKRHTKRTSVCSASFALRSAIKAADPRTLYDLATAARVPGLWRLELHEGDVVDPRLLSREGLVRRLR